MPDGSIGLRIQEVDDSPAPPTPQQAPAKPSPRPARNRMNTPKTRAMPRAWLPDLRLPARPSFGMLDPARSVDEEIDELELLTQPGREEELKTFLLLLHPADVAELVDDASDKVASAILRHLDSEHAAQLISELDPSEQERVLAPEPPSCSRHERHTPLELDHRHPSRPPPQRPRRSTVVSPPRPGPLRRTKSAGDRDAATVRTR